MANNKKNFEAEFNELLGVTAATGINTAPTGKPTPKQPKAEPEGVAASVNAEANLPCCTFRMDADTLSRLRAAAYAETGKQGKRVTITAVLKEALTDYFAKNGY